MAVPARDPSVDAATPAELQGGWKKGRGCIHTVNPATPFVLHHARQKLAKGRGFFISCRAGWREKDPAPARGAGIRFPANGRYVLAGLAAFLTQSTMRILPTLSFCWRSLAAIATELKKQKPLRRQERREMWLPLPSQRERQGSGELAPLICLHLR